MGQRYAGLSWDGFMEEKQQNFGGKEGEVTNQNDGFSQVNFGTPF